MTIAGRIVVVSASPGATVTLAPDSTETTPTPELKWKGEPCATSYDVWVADSTGATVVNTNVTAGTAITASTADCSGPCFECRWTVVSPAIAAGKATWWVRAHNAVGPSGWSPAGSFQVGSCVPTRAPKAIGPDRTAGARIPTFTWMPVGCATSYELWVSDSVAPSPAFGSTVTAADAGCSNGVSMCSWTPQTSFDRGSVTWYVRGKNGVGTAGPYTPSPGNTFTIP